MGVNGSESTSGATEISIVPQSAKIFVAENPRDWSRELEALAKGAYSETRRRKHLKRANGHETFTLRN